ncbi:outer membrane protein, OMP85 family [Nautilia profundicola AmH]|uniref:Outer membrane protein assembly factor BamA n=1 Tax=Nautilia profundicola (strain ATCC BAA-1463 / DSM 18972 / AmH) TaxID=598659 RepID=B9L681_NAUPA|nr:outer membrane protein assembly factor BamA [Nautilia profundicola]ACM92800.1 outer membrane protein, OMP85 family [Nautilia profundicola AmH]
MKKTLLLFPLILFAQIDKIEYKGLLHISPITANSIIKIHKNDNFNVEKIDESIKALYKTGYFQTIKAVKEGNTLIFECLEKPTILKVDFENLSEDLKKLLKERGYMPKKGEILSLEKLDNLKEFIKAYYLSKGYFNTIVNIEKKFVTPTSVKLTISIKKGEELVIKDVKFFGAKKISKDELLEETENRPRTFWSAFPFTNSGRLNIYKLISDKEALQNYYLNLGFMDAYVSDPLAKSNFDNYSATIDYSIYEGIRYLVKKIDIDYPKNIKVTLPELNLKTDKYFNVSALREDMKNIQHAFANEGYAYAKVYPEIKKEGSNAFITYKVIPGEIVYIRNVIINGNTKTLDRVIRRNVYLAPGDKFSYRDLTDSKNALQRSGYLEDVKIEQKKVSSNQIDLIVNVKEGLSGSLKAGISYGSYSKLGFNFAITEKNVFGSGQSVSASADFSSVSRTYRVSLVNPRVFDTKYSFNTSIFDTNFEGISYTSRQKGFTAGVGKRLSRYVGANITYGFTKTKLSDYNTTEYTMPESTKSYVVASVSYNNTDNYFFPTSGHKASISAEFAGLGGDEKYIKTLAQYKYFYPLKDKTYKTYAVLKYRIIAGMINDNGYLPINEKFYLGGIRSVRGFSSYSISPVDDEGNKIGGKYKLVTGPEISTPLSIKNKVWLSGFIDYGVIGENGLDIKRSSFGFSLDWITPMGPLCFVWAWPIKSEPGDDLQRFEFSIGASF